MVKIAVFFLLLVCPFAVSAQNNAVGVGMAASFITECGFTATEQIMQVVQLTHAVDKESLLDGILIAGAQMKAMSPSDREAFCAEQSVEWLAQGFVHPK